MWGNGKGREFSRQTCLSHHRAKLFSGDGTIAIPVRLVNHLLQLLVTHRDPQLACDALEVLHLDVSLALRIKQLEHSREFILFILFLQMEEIYKCGAKTAKQEKA